MREYNDVASSGCLFLEDLVSETFESRDHTRCTFSCRKFVAKNASLVTICFKGGSNFCCYLTPVLLHDQGFNLDLNLKIIWKLRKDRFKRLNISYTRRGVETYRTTIFQKLRKCRSEILCLLNSFLGKWDVEVVENVVDAVVDVLERLCMPADNYSWLFDVITPFSWFFLISRVDSLIMSTTPKIKTGDVLLTLRDKDVFPQAPEVTGVIWKDRLTGKAVILNNTGEIALIGNKVNDLFMLPGGGIENNEDPIAGTKRECQEETGCTIEITHALGVTEDFRARDAKHCISFGYIGKVVAQGSPKLTENETDIGAYVTWLPLPKARELFATQEEKVRRGEVRFYNTCFNIIRDSLFIRRAEDALNA